MIARALVAAPLVALAFAAPAQADWDMLDHREDPGYDAAIKVRCAAGYTTSVPENDTAGRGWSICNSPVDAVWMRAGEELRCLRVNYYGDLYWAVVADKNQAWTGLSSTTDDGRGCEMVRD